MTVDAGAESSLGNISNQLQISRSKKKNPWVTTVCCREAKNNHMSLKEPLISQNHV